MSTTLMAALLAEFTALVLLRVCHGRRWLRRPVCWLVIVGVLYHGISAIALSIPSVRVWNTNGQGISQQYTDTATFAMSVGLLTLTVCYLVTGPWRSSTNFEAVAQSARKILDWRILALLSIPLLVVTYSGRGYNTLTPMSGAATPLSTDLVATFFEIAILLAAFGFLLRHGMRWFVAVLIVQSIILAAAGERTPVVTDAVILLILLALMELRPSRKQIVAGAFVAMVVILGLTGYRTVSGRQLYTQDTGFRARAEGVVTGLFATGQARGINIAQPGLVAQAAIRFDGDSFAGGILQAIHMGQPVLGAKAAGPSVLVAVPSALWPSKLGRADLNPAMTEINDFGLQQINFLPTFGGLYMGYLGPFWTVIFMAACGLAFGWGERWLFRRSSLARLIMTAGAMGAALTYEQGLPGMVVELRKAFALVIVVKLIEWLRAVERVGIPKRYMKSRDIMSRLKPSQGSPAGQVTSHP